MDLPPSTAWGTRTQTITDPGQHRRHELHDAGVVGGLHLQPATGNTATVTFTAATVRYVKLTFTANTGWPAGQLSELQVYAS